MEHSYKQQLDAMTDGLDQWCERCVRRRARLRHSATLMLALAFTLGIASLLMPSLGNTWVQGKRVGEPTMAYSSINQMLLGQ